MLKFDNNENSVRMFFEIPVAKPTGISLPNEELFCNRDKKILSAFANRLIGTLERRMSACESKLMNHLGDALTNGKVIYWLKKDRQSHDHFVIASYEAMAKAIDLIKCEEWSGIMYNEIILDQIIKALLNDTEQDHSDSNGYTYAQLVTLLMAMYNNIIRDRTLGKGGL